MLWTNTEHWKPKRCKYDCTTALPDRRAQEARHHCAARTLVPKGDASYSREDLHCMPMQLVQEIYEAISTL